MKLQGKIQKILPFYLKDGEKKRGGWVVIEVPSGAPEGLITENNETVIINLDFGEKDFESHTSLITIFMEKIPKDFEKGKKVTIEVRT